MARSPVARDQKYNQDDGYCPGTVVPDGTTPGGRHYRCKEIGSYTRAQELLRQGHTYLDSNGDGEACESLKH